MNLNVKATMMLILGLVEAVSMGVLTAILPHGVDIATLELRKRGAMVLLSLNEVIEKWDGTPHLKFEILILWRADSKAPSAGEIQASILSGLTAIPIFRREGYDIVAKHLLNKHVSFTPGAKEGEPGVDLHSSAFELVMVKTDSKEAAEVMEAKEA